MTRNILAITTALLLVTATSASAGILGANTLEDDFNRDDNNSLGVTSHGGRTWEKINDDGAAIGDGDDRIRIEGNVMHVGDGVVGSSVGNSDEWGELGPFPTDMAIQFDLQFGPITGSGTTDPDDGGPLASPVTEYEYDDAGNLISITDPLDNVTAFAYDDLNRRISITETDPDGGGAQTSPVTTFEYDDAGNLANVVDPLGNETTYTYDLVNRQIHVTLPDPDDGGALESPVMEYNYDAVGNLLSETDALDEVTRYAYDRLNRLTSVISPDGGASSFTYDEDGNRTSATDPLDRTTVFVYDSLNRLTSITDPLEEVTSFTYDAFGNQTSVTDPEDNLTEFVYDGLNRLIERIDPLEESTLYEYDAASNVTEITDREGRERTFAYDNLDRLITETWLDGMTTVNTLSFTYDAVGNKLTADDSCPFREPHRRLAADGQRSQDGPNSCVSRLGRQLRRGRTEVFDSYQGAGWYYCSTVRIVPIGRESAW